MSGSVPARSAPAAGPAVTSTPLDAEVRIRPLRVTDLPHLLELERACFTGVYAAHRFTRAHFLSYGRGARAFCAVAVAADRPVGYVAAALGIGRCAQILRLDSLAVGADARQAGLGSRLLQHAIEEARRRGCRHVALEVAEINRDAQGFFLARGFLPFRRLPGYYAPHRAGLRLRRAVREPPEAAPREGGTGSPARCATAGATTIDPTGRGST